MKQSSAHSSDFLSQSATFAIDNTPLIVGAANLTRLRVASAAMTTHVVTTNRLRGERNKYLTLDHFLTSIFSSHGDSQPHKKFNSSTCCPATSRMSVRMAVPERNRQMLRFRWGGRMILATRGNTMVTGVRFWATPMTARSASAATLCRAEWLSPHPRRFLSASWLVRLRRRPTALAGCDAPPSAVRNVGHSGISILLLKSRPADGPAISAAASTPLRTSRVEKR